MTWMHAVLLLIFIAATLIGYKIINRVPVGHTSMSGMNAFSGVTLLGCLAVTAVAIGVGAKALGMIAIVWRRLTWSPASASRTGC